MSSPPYTDQQRAALLARDVSVALDAGAGCGKTFVLTERFLSHLDPEWDAGPPAELDEVVAITFTDAAAREMRQRIRQKCRERLAAAGADQQPFWRGLLRSLDAARVSTIHSFCSDLVRQYAVELGVDPAFRVIDGAVGQTMLSTAVDDLIRDRLASAHGDAPGGVIAAAARVGVAPLRDWLRTLTDARRDDSFDRWRSADPGECVEAWRVYYREVVAPAHAAELADHPAAVRLLELGERAEPRPAFAQRLNDLRSTFASLRDSADPSRPLRELLPLLESKDPATGKMVHTAKDWPDAEKKKQFTSEMRTLRDTLKKQRHLGDPESMADAARLGIELLRLAGEAADRYSAEKQRQGVLDLDDLLHEARRLLTSSSFEQARRRIASKVRVLLVDEFQDTDRTQADIVRAIVAGEADEPSEGPIGSAKLFFVGDYKQSIYRFRGAEPEVFRQMQRATPAGGRLPLSMNFRSQPAVIDFVNTLFGGLFGASYEPLRGARAQAVSRPAVEFLWAPAPFDPDAPDDARPSAERQRRAEARLLAARLRQLIDSQEAIVVDKQTGQARPARSGDVALLFRALSNVALYEEALREAGFDYYLSGGHAFYAQQEVRDVAHLLRAIGNACDEIALIGVLRSPFFGLKDESLYWLAKRGAVSDGLFAEDLPEQLEAEERRVALHARETLRRLRKLKDRTGASELLSAALDATGYEASLLAEFLGERKLANLEKLREQAREADAARAGLPGLLRLLTEFTTRLPKEALASTTSEDRDAVRLMTVHHAKGLEFPIVVLPDLNGRPNPDRGGAAFDPRLGPLVKAESGGDAPPVGYDFYRAEQRRQDQQEQDRLFYVACTRAADRLILSACLDDPEKPTGQWLKRLQNGFDLSTGEPVAPATGESPLVTVTAPETIPGVRRKGGSLVSFAKVYEKALGKNGKALLPAGVAPIGVDSDDLVSFSVTRLSGKLRRESSDEPVEESNGASSTGIDPLRFGTLTHAVLERIDPRSTDPNADARRWTRALASQHLPLQAEAAVEACDELVGRFLAGPRWADLLSATRYEREVEFLLPWPPPGAGSKLSKPARLRGYIDVLWRDGRGDWRVLDYKTNQVLAEGVPQEAEAYRLQLSVYALAVEASLGVRPASLVLSFLRPGIEHELLWGEDERAEAIERIDQAIADTRGLPI